MLVYLVMGNSFPAGIWDNWFDAEEYCKARRKENKMIYWRVIECVVNQGE